MKIPYISPELKLVCFMPLEGIALEQINLDLELVNLGTTYNLKRSATEGDPTTEEDDDMFLPIG